MFGESPALAILQYYTSDSHTFKDTAQIGHHFYHMQYADTIFVEHV